jgi:acetyl esterase/lipase
MTRALAPRFAFALACGLTSGCAFAENVVRLWPGVAPGSEQWTWQEQAFPDQQVDHRPIGTVIQDVVTPTLTAYLPGRGHASGTGVVIAPGGACISLVIDSEGRDIARQLQQMGVAAFVLKYRLLHKTAQGIPKDLSEDQACSWGIADATQAIKLVRQHASDWGVAPNRIGLLGFSAGGMIASEVLVQQDASLRPDFAALIYGAPFESMPPVPAGLPPVFMAWAQDDDTAAGVMTRFYQALLKAGNKPEAHIYDTGGHGFAAQRADSSSAHWLQEFAWWLQSRKWAAR